jgi:hypothetical protein
MDAMMLSTFPPDNICSKGTTARTMSIKGAFRRVSAIRVFLRTEEYAPFLTLLIFEGAPGVPMVSQQEQRIK